MSWRVAPTTSRPFASAEGLRNLDVVARRYGTRPSALIDVDDPYLAYCLDEAAAIVGLRAETEALEGEGREGTRTNRPATGGMIRMEQGIPTISGKIPIIRKPKR